MIENIIQTFNTILRMERNTNTIHFLRKHHNLSWDRFIKQFRAINFVCTLWYLFHIYINKHDYIIFNANMRICMLILCVNSVSLDHYSLMQLMRFYKSLDNRSIRKKRYWYRLTSITNIIVWCTQINYFSSYIERKINIFSVFSLAILYRKAFRNVYILNVCGTIINYG